MIKKIISISLTIFTIGCLYFMSKGLVGTAAAYILIAFNVARVFVEVYATRLIVNKLKMPESIKQEIPRKLGHMLISFITGPMIYFSFKETIHMPICIIAIFIFVLIIEHTKLIRLISRNDNDTNNLESIKYYVLASMINFIIAYFNPAYLMPTMLGFMTVGAGDPCACFIGKLFGKHKIYKHKSLEGSIGFIVGAIIAMYIFSGISIYYLIPIAICGAIAELYSDKYDNLVIQLVTALIAFIIL